MLPLHGHNTAAFKNLFQWAGLTLNKYFNFFFLKEMFLLNRRT